MNLTKLAERLASVFKRSPRPPYMPTHCEWAYWRSAEEVQRGVCFGGGPICDKCKAIGKTKGWA